MMKRIIAFGLVLWVISACDALHWFQTTLYENDGVRTVIFHANAARQDIYAFPYTSDELQGYWTPTLHDVTELEGALLSYLEATNPPQFSDNPPIWQRLDEYDRQYAGLIVDDQEIIYGNFLCADFEDDALRGSMMLVMDGGECFFSVIYDVDSKEILRLSVNGEA